MTTIRLSSCGFMGMRDMGKSVLCAQIINSLKDTSEGPVAYFFCSSENKTQQEPLAIIRSWIWQATDYHENALDQALEIRAKEMRRATRTDNLEAIRINCNYDS